MLVFIGLSNKLLIKQIMMTSSLLFILHNSIAFFISINEATSIIVNLLIILLSILLIIISVISFKKNNLNINFKKRYGLILFCLGLIIVSRALFNIIGYLLSDKMSLPDMAVNVSNFILCSLWIISGLLLILKKNLGIILATTSNIHAVLLFTSIMLFLIGESICKRHIFVEDITITGLMSLFAIIPSIIMIKKLNIK